MSSVYEPTTLSEDRHWAFANGDVPVAVYGLGKMGLPLAAVYAESTGNVIGVDVDASVVERVNRGESPVVGEPGLDELVSDLVKRQSLRATTDGEAAAADANVHVVIVPTLIDDDDNPDLSVVREVAETIASGLDTGDLVIFESTLPPGATETVLHPLLVSESDLREGEFGVAFCPERTSSGRALADVRGTHPKIVGGVDPESTRAAEVVYRTLVDNEVIPVSDATTAEAVKVFEGLYRDVNIALANELARFADELGADVREAIDAANTQPYCDIHTPGPGVGGHCIPYYPYFVLNWLSGDAPLLGTAREVNDSMPAFVADRVREGLDAVDVPPAEATVLVLGLTYRAGVKETRASPALGVCTALSTAGMDVFAADPLVDTEGFDALDVSIADAFDLDPDAVVLVTDHDEFADLDWTTLDPTVVVDGRDALDARDLDRLGHHVYTVGRGWR
jgi:UDP-N-acetyl-D-mannosaminuronic acid dehydrogenase